MPAYLLAPAFLTLQIGEEITYGERILNAMRLCCCVDILCGCWTEPKRAPADKNWKKGSSSGWVGGSGIEWVWPWACDFR